MGANDDGGTRRRGSRGKKKSKGESDGLFADGLLEEVSLPQDNHLLATWRENLANNKPHALLLDYHNIVLRVKGKVPQFRCRNCHSACIPYPELNEHIKKLKHRSVLELNRMELTLSKLVPPPTVIDKLGEFLEKEIVNSRLTKETYTRKLSVFNEIQAEVLKVLPGSTLQLVGSTDHGLGLDDGDLNMSLTYNDTVSVLKVGADLKLISDCHDFKRRFKEEKKLPAICFTWKGKVPCQLLLLDENSLRLTKLLKEYGKIDERCGKLCVLFRKWASVCQIDGQTEGFLSSQAIYILVVYFLQQISSPVLPVLPVLNELLPTPGETVDIYEDVMETVRSRWVTTNTQTVAELWIQMLIFYSHEFDSSSFVVRITQLDRYKKDGPLAGKRLSVMDPFEPERNLMRTVGNSTMYDYMMHCLKTTCMYFIIPQFVEGPIFGSILQDPKVDKTLNIPGYEEFLETQIKLSHNIIRLIPLTDTNYIADAPTESLAKTFSSVLHKINSTKGDYVNMCSINVNDFNGLFSRKSPKPSQYKNYALLHQDAKYLMNRIDPNKLFYQFSNSLFTADSPIPNCCVICSKNGHSQHNCPETVMEKLDEIIVDDELKQLIDTVCASVFSECVPTLEDMKMKEHAFSNLQSYIVSVFPEAELALFGSSQNGFGLRTSDMDICLTFHQYPSSDGLPSNILNTLFKHLRRNRLLKKLILIRNAKVPIIKFLHIPTNLEGDISLYNILAQENTKLLRTYSEIDERVKILGYMVKRLAKVCNVGDASKGSLSSYCYVLMMIYFLQGCDPPVLPVLQALPQSSTPLPTKMIDGWNTYFFSDLSQLKEVWPQLHCNSKSPGELWLEFLKFYTEDFDMENLVVSIRTTDKLSKCQKRWFGRTLAIEDPFVLDRNLGSGLKIRMHYFIMKAFGKARNLFSKKLKPSGNKPIDKMYFDEQILAKTEPPHDRGCRACKSIGHKVSDCPERKFMEEESRGKVRVRKNKSGSTSETKPENAIQKKTAERPGGVPQSTLNIPTVPSVAVSGQWPPSPVPPGSGQSLVFHNSNYNQSSGFAPGQLNSNLYQPLNDAPYAPIPAPEYNQRRPSQAELMQRWSLGAPLLSRSAMSHESSIAMQTRTAQSNAYQSIMNQLKKSNKGSSKKNSRP